MNNICEKARCYAYPECFSTLLFSQGGFCFLHVGYITNVKKNGTTIATYSYDALGQLVREINADSGEIYVYTYDKAGNITKKEVYTGDIGNLTDTINYTYSTSSWKDLLTDYDGTEISYDHIGNPTNWVGISSLTWSGSSLDRAVLQSEHYVDYTYNSDGIRTRKYEYNGTDMYLYDHNYVLDGSTIVKETIEYASAFNGNYLTTLEYYYDESGIASFRYNGTLYYYVKNLQGDVIGIMDGSGAVVVEYAYDAWGNILSVTGSLASTVGQINPFRYCGYYYDSETGLYYLNSRYYDSEVGRFISADKVSLLGYDLQNLNQCNMYAYCWNNPVSLCDHMGCYPKEKLWQIIVPIIVVVSVFIIIPEIIETSNYTNNQRAQSQLPDGYIDSQKDVDYMKMGIKGAAWNGCGWIAVYNAMIMLGKKQDAANIIRYFDSKITNTIFYGYFGVSPIAIKRYFTQHGCFIDSNSVPFLYSPSMEIFARSSDACILLYVHSEAAHYVALKWENGSFRVYNGRGQNHASIKEYLDVAEGTLLFIWFINN